MSQLIRDLFKNEKMIGKGLAVLTMVVLILTVTTSGTFAAFWRTVAGNTNPYQTATSLSNASTFTYGYGYSGTSLWGYGYGYGYNVNNALGYLTGDGAYTSTTAVSASTLSSVASGTGTAATQVTVNSPALITASGPQSTTISVVLPAGVVITEADSETFDTTTLAATSVNNNSLTNTQMGGSTNASVGAVSFGVSGSGKVLRFSIPIQIAIPVPGRSPTSSVNIGALHAGDTAISSTSLSTNSGASCSAGVASPSSSTATVNSAGNVVIYTCAASTFTAYVTTDTSTTTTTTTTTSGGGGGGSIERCRNKESGKYVNGKADKSGYCKGKEVAMAVETPAATTDDYKPGEVAAAFMDTASHWAASYIEQLRTAGIVHGKRPGSFEPNAPLTRGELVKIALNAFGVSVPASAAVKPFTDVEASAWYAPYIAKAKELGIVQGYANGAFKPNQTINRAEALKILIGASGLDVSTDTNALKAKGWTYVHFTDVPVSAWYAGYVDYAKTNAVVGGYGNGLFGPGNPVLRGEMAKMAAKVMELAK